LRTKQRVVLEDNSGSKVVWVREIERKGALFRVRRRGEKECQFGWFKFVFPSRLR